MKALSIIARRLLFGLVTAWAVFTTVFLAFTATSDWVAQRIEGHIRASVSVQDPPPLEVVEGEIEEAINAYLAERGLDRPLHEQYLDWMVNMLTLEWGNSFVTGEEVFPLVWGATLRTGQYVLPAIVLAVLFGILIGLGAAMFPNSRLADSSRLASYVLFAIPSFWIGGLLFSAVIGGAWDPAPWVFEHALPILLVAMTLLGGYVSYSRAHGMEYVAADFVTLVRAKGAGPLDVAKHVLRNAAIPLFAMLFTEALGLLVLAIFVIEVLFGIPGFGLEFFRAIDARDLPVVFGATMVIIVVGVLGNVIQDLSYQYLDPRVEEGG